MRKATRAQWIKCGTVSLLYIAFLIWVKSWWGVIAIPFIFDVYISKKIPWGFWKELKNPAARSIMSWVDAIVFALIAVYFVNIYIFQNYQIPSSSLEKSLLVGDYLYVSKMSYGPRVPNTPLSMPLAQHTLPLFNTKSYIEWPQWKYKRVAGFGKVQRDDIVVFNFPAGDTVATNFQQTDFYSLAYEEGKRIYPNQVDMDSLTRRQQRTVYDLYYNAGRNLIRSNPQMYGDIVVRPVDRRENYVKRCIGLPGDTLQIKQGEVYIDGKAIKSPTEMQFNYFVQTTGAYIPEELFRELGISIEDRLLMSNGTGWEENLISMGLNLRNAQGNLTPVYHLPLTRQMHETLLAHKKLISKIVIEPDEFSGQMYPQNLYSGWTRDNYGPIWIPAKGATIQLTADNLPIYERCIVAYEGNKLEVKEDGIYINGEKSDSYTFQMDYYWMMGDNRHNSADSRYWGFVPEDHVVGKPIVVWLSLDKDRGWFSGKIRWNRIFKWVDNIK
ncbi:signal peptidase I [uncultured Bacteroides sp.]|uniref:signal peptidase I n=1 Tax=uncultured Bacteroides sp. TaxID=162156 RepID=UPI0023BCBD7A|nr:signal peptidase I [uncultured Bacteroides sp.]MDE5711481.1 signal peptidase I [Bacteroides sp.]